MTEPEGRPPSETTRADTGHGRPAGPGHGGLEEGVASPPHHPPSGPAPVPPGDDQLRRDSLGVAAITFFVISAAAPLTAVAGGVPISMLLGNGAGIPAAFLLVTALLLVFAKGYVAMARHVTSAGAFYALVARGLGGVAGGAAALVAILSYNAMQIGVFAMFGSAASGLAASASLQAPWWAFTGAGIACVAVLGYRRVDLSARILTLLVIAEYVVVLAIDAAIVARGGAHGLTLASFEPSHFMSGSPAIGVLFCFAAFIGFEATTIYSEEARAPERTVPRATYLSVILIGALYAATSWLMVNAVGADSLVPDLQALGDPTRFFFEVGGRYVGGWLPPVMRVLFVTSLFAGVLAFHNGVARYMYVAGRERLLPAWLGRTHRVYQSPHAASVVQTILAALVTAGFAAAGQDPVLGVFTWLTNVGTLGIIVLMALASFAALFFFRSNRSLEPGVVATLACPAASGVALAIVIVATVIHFDRLTGTSGWLGSVLPGLVLAAAVAGALLAWRLKQHRPADFARLGAPRRQA